MTMTVDSATGRARWLAVTTVAVGTFTIVTSEMLPVGLLTSIAADLRVSEGTAGLMMTVPGLVAAVSAPVLAVAARGLDRRLTLLGLMALLAGANLVAALATDYLVMLAARVLTGVSIGGFWAFAAGLGARLVPERSVGRATSVILSGVSVASVLGVPAAAFVSSFASWQAAFAAAGVLALVLVALLAATLPPLPGTTPSGTVRASSASRNPSLRRVPRPLRVVLVLTVLMVSGHFAAYTYTCGRSWSRSRARVPPSSASLSCCTGSPAWRGTSRPGVRRPSGPGRCSSRWRSSWPRPRRRCRWPGSPWRRSWCGASATAGWA